MKRCAKSRKAEEEERSRRHRTKPKPIDTGVRSWEEEEAEKKEKKIAAGDFFDGEKYDTRASAVSTIKGGVTYQMGKSTADPAYEVEVFKCILLRESYITQFKNIVNRNFSSAEVQQKLYSLVDMMRMATVETVEALTRWKSQQTGVNAQLKWNGINYLLRIPSDLDFMSKSEGAIAVLETDFIRNPFLLGTNLDERPATATINPQGAGEATFSHPSSRNAATGDLPGPNSPYITPVINDSSMNPRTMGAKSRGGKRKLLSPAPSKSQISKNVVHLSETIKVRIQNAEKVLLAEEQIHGAYTRNEIGRLVPASIGNDEHNVHGTHTKPLPFPSTISVQSKGGEMHSRAAQARAAVESNAPPQPFDPATPPMPRSTKLRGKIGGNLEVQMSVKPVAPEDIAKKIGGDFVPPTKRVAESRLIVPHQKSRIDRMKDAILHKKDEVQQMKAELENLREKEKNVGEELEAAKAIEISDKQDQDLLQGYEMNDGEFKSPAVLKLGLQLERIELEIKNREVIYDQSVAELNRKLAVSKEYARRMHVQELKRQKASLKKAQAMKQDLGAVKKDEGAKPVSASTLDMLSPNAGRSSPEAMFDDSDEDDLEPFSLENELATRIQRIARGKIGRMKTRVKRETDTAACTVIQKVTRGRKGRAFALKTRIERNAARLLQRLEHGRKARKRVRKLRKFLLEKASSTRIQAAFRAMKGRRRSKDKSKLIKAYKQCIVSTNSIVFSDCMEVAKCHVMDVPPNLLSLAQCLMILTAKGIAPPPDRAGHVLNWRSAKRAIRRETFLGKIKAMSRAARDLVLVVHPERIPAVEQYFHDPNFHWKELVDFPGYHTARQLFYWVENMVTCARLMPQFLKKGALDSQKWSDVCSFDLDEEPWEPRKDDYDSAAVDPLEYVPEDLLAQPCPRPRPLLVAFARDVPTNAKEALIRKLMGSLQGFFVRIDKPSIDINLVQQVLSSGKNGIILDVDIGETKSTRRTFNRHISMVKAALVPTPLCVLVTGDRLNRASVPVAEGEEALYRAAREDAHEMLGVFETEEKFPEVGIKKCLETAATSIFTLTTKSSIEDLARVVDLEKPSQSTVLIGEAIMILLAPEEKYKPPDAVLSAVSWKGSKKLFKTSAKTLVQRLRNVRADDISPENFRVLKMYLKHKRWPHDAHEKYQRLLHGSKTLAHLATWVVAIVSYAAKVQNGGGMPDKISRWNDVFSAVVSVKDGIRGLGEGFVTGPDSWPKNHHGELASDFDGIEDANVQLMMVLLRDMKVYSVSKKIIIAGRSKRHLVILTVTHDEENIFISGYQPENSRVYGVVVKSDQINRLLAPNSVELEAPRSPPITYEQLYARLIELVKLERPRQTIVGAPQLPLVLNLQRHRSRLLRETRRIDCSLVVITVTEDALNELIIDAYLPLHSEHHELRVNGKTIERLCATPHITERETDDLESGVGMRIGLRVLDRVTLRRLRGTTDRSNMGLRYGGPAGQKIYQGSFNLGSVKHVVSVFLETPTKAFNILVYNPWTSKRTCFHIPARARIELLGSLNKGDQPECLKRAFERLHLEGDGSITRRASKLGKEKNLPPPRQRGVIFDAVITKFSLRLSVFRNVKEEKRGEDSVIPKKQETSLARFEVSIPSPENIGIPGEATLLIAAFHVDKTQQYDMLLHDAAIRKALSLESAEHVWPAKSKAELVDTIRILCKHLILCEQDGSYGKQPLLFVLGKRNDPVATCTARVRSKSNSKSSGVKAEETEKIPKQKLRQPHFVSAALQDKGYVAKVPVVGVQTNPAGEKVHRRGYAKNGRNVIVTVYKTYRGDAGKDRVLTFQVHDADASRFDTKELAGDSLLSAVGRKADMMKDENEEKMIEYLIKERMSLLSIDEAIEENLISAEQSGPEPLKIRFEMARLFAPSKVTPVNLQEFDDVEANEKDDRIILEKESAKRGLKLCSIGHHIKIESSHDVGGALSEDCIITVFDVGTGDLYKEQGYGVGPNLRIQAYTPSSQQSSALLVTARQLFEIVKGRRELFYPSKSKELVQKVLPFLFIRRRLKKNDQLCLSKSYLHLAANLDLDLDATEEKDNTESSKESPTSFEGTAKANAVAVLEDTYSKQALAAPKVYVGGALSRGGIYVVARVFTYDISTLKGEDGIFTHSKSGERDGVAVRLYEPEQGLTAVHVTELHNVANSLSRDDVATHADFMQLDSAAQQQLWRAYCSECLIVERVNIVDDEYVLTVRCASARKHAVTEGPLDQSVQLVRKPLLNRVLRLDSIMCVVRILGVYEATSAATSHGIELHVYSPELFQQSRLLLSPEDVQRLLGLSKDEAIRAVRCPPLAECLLPHLSLASEGVDNHMTVRIDDSEESVRALKKAAAAALSE